MASGHLPPNQPHTTTHNPQRPPNNVPQTTLQLARTLGETSSKWREFTHLGGHVDAVAHVDAALGVHKGVLAVELAVHVDARAARRRRLVVAVGETVILVTFTLLSY